MLNVHDQCTIWHIDPCGSPSWMPVIQNNRILTGFVPGERTERRFKWAKHRLPRRATCGFEKLTYRSDSTAYCGWKTQDETIPSTKSDLPAQNNCELLFKLLATRLFSGQRTSFGLLVTSRLMVMGAAIILRAARGCKFIFAFFVGH